MELKEIFLEFNSTTDINRRLYLANLYFSIPLNKRCIETAFSYPNYPMDVEIFKNISGYEGVYQIGSFGTVKSVERILIKGKRGGHKMAVYLPEKIRKNKINNKGYVTTSLWVNGKPKFFFNHRLVASEFIPNFYNKPLVLHKDDNPLNPCWYNLEWGTQSENVIDSIVKGRWAGIGSNNCNAKLSEDEIPIIRDMVKSGISDRVIASKFNVSKSQIAGIRRNEIWVHVK